jgi:hypothetical protein
MSASTPTGVAHPGRWRPDSEVDERPLRMSGPDELT